MKTRPIVYNLLAASDHISYAACATPAHSERERITICVLRDEVMQVARYGWPFTFDVPLPSPSMEEYIAAARVALSQHCLAITAGYLGT